ncbi:TetR/AcrR family transcriptional regulator [Streptosporangium minutum]|uniref:Transcriptional regulator n=1 Tax=Streptosporangium minutum TaxID=569862 RepID=A0A243RLW8_9ACTN|nr:TetR family transcriptional regulator [Streptosporangium minutum]OUC95875.1 transcriptional regulator [Streptosporangium minutum]
MGRRERKKAQTRQALSDTALRLFLEHGYDSVTIAQIAEEADIAVATVFAYFPDGKESLIFDDGVERRDRLVAAVRDRPEGQPVLRALREFLATRGPFRVDPSPQHRRRTELVMDTPALRGYQGRLWTRSQDALAEAIADESGRDPADITVRALARYVLEIPDLAAGEPDPRHALNAVFDLLESGWPAP